MIKLTTRQLAITGLLGAVAVVLGMTPLGFIPVPTPAGHATIMHIPAILGGILEGPVVGGLVGLIFGVHSFLRATNAFFADPIISILPRVFIGVMAYMAYRITKSGAAAAVIGTATNTIGVLGLIVLKGYLPMAAAVGIGITHGIPEIAVAVLLTVLLVKGIQRFRR
ncbi:MAG: hypothetical protein PWQ82_731 [Thermosediminibacterales bacterium]|nr:hypothetical protein [Thermosediminibacterales bacterium]